MIRLTLAALTALAFLSACANTPRSANTASVDDAALNRIASEIAAATAQFDAALQRYRAGEIAPALASMDAARAALTATGTRCAALSGCELTRVIAAQDALLQRQTQVLLEPDGFDRDARTDGSAPGAGEGSDVGGASPLLRELPAAARTVQLLKGRSLRDAIVMNGPVQAALEEWLTWMRPFMLDAYENYQYMRYAMHPAYEQAGLPEALLFGIMAKESGGRVHSISSAGASGPLQFMPATGTRFGLGRQPDGFDTRFDPAAAARANAAYLNEQFGRLNNDLALVLAAYNGGEGRVGRLSGGGQRGFWDRAVFDTLPPETRNYVPMVLAAAWLFLHAEDYGLVWPKIDARPAHIELRQLMSLNELAVCMGQDGNPRGWFRTLRNLNPRHQPEARLPVGTRVQLPEAARVAYQRHCVDGARRDTARRLADALPPQPAPAGTPAARAVASAARSHVVKGGETLSAVARRYQCRGIAALARANNLRGPGYAIRVGQRLQIPSPCR